MQKSSLTPLSAELSPGLPQCHHSQSFIFRAVNYLGIYNFCYVVTFFPNDEDPELSITQRPEKLFNYFLPLTFSQTLISRS